jgi:hypothetical protein
MKTILEYILNKDTKIIKKRDPEDPNTWCVGDILVGSGGYNMTLVYFYEIKSKTAKSFKLRRLNNKCISGGGMQGECVPDEGNYDIHEKEISCRINKYGRLRVGGKYGHTVYLWDGKPQWYDHMD